MFENFGPMFENFGPEIENQGRGREKIGPIPICSPPGGGGRTTEESLAPRHRGRPTGEGAPRRPARGGWPRRVHAVRQGLGDRLKDLCRALGLDDGGKEEAASLARIAGEGPESGSLPGDLCRRGPTGGTRWRAPPAAPPSGSAEGHHVTTSTSLTELKHQRNHRVDSRCQ